MIYIYIMLFILVYIIFYDIWFYFIHILLHTKIIYKNIHNVHHQIQYDKLTYKDTNIAHLLENIIQPLGILIPFFIYKQPLINIHFIIAYIIVYVRGLMRHDKRFEYLIGNHHLLHHKYSNYNYGEYWLDYLFNTIYPNPKEYVYGIIYT